MSSTQVESATFHMPDRTITVALTRRDFSGRYDGVTITIDGVMVPITGPYGGYISYEESLQVKTAYDQAVKVVNLIAKGNQTGRGARLDTKLAYDVARDGSQYTLFQKSDGSKYVAVKSGTSNAKYTVVRDVTGVIQSTDRGWIFNQTSKHVDFVTRKGWL